ncbi:hypothetical protein PSHT_10033, partial [Puccinia striiformis]
RNFLRPAKDWASSTMLAINLPRRSPGRLAGVPRNLPPKATSVKAAQCKTPPVFIEVNVAQKILDLDNNDLKAFIKKDVLVPFKLFKEKLIILKETLQKDCHKLIEKTVETGGTIDYRSPLNFKNISNICDRHDMEVVIGGEAFNGQINTLMESMGNYINDPHNQYPGFHAARNESVVLRDVSMTQQLTCENSLLEKKPPRRTACSEEANLTKVEIEQMQAESEKRKEEMQKVQRLQIMSNVKGEY